MSGVGIPISPSACSPSGINAGDTAWVLSASLFVLLQTPATGLFQAGLVRGKNAVSLLAQTRLGVAVGFFLWFAINFSLSFAPSSNGLFGSAKHAFFAGIDPHACHPAAPTIPAFVFAVYQGVFALMAPLLVSGAWAERMRLLPTALFCAFWGTAVYAPCAHSLWDPTGWLSKWGALDFAGGAVVHLSSGVASLVVAAKLERRKGFVRLNNSSKNNNNNNNNNAVGIANYSDGNGSDFSKETGGIMYENGGVDSNKIIVRNPGRAGSATAATSNTRMNLNGDVDADEDDILIEEPVISSVSTLRALNHRKNNINYNIGNNNVNDKNNSNGDHSIYKDDEEEEEDHHHDLGRGHSLPLTFIGGELTATAWLCFTAGAAYEASPQAGSAAFVTLLGASTGTIAWCILDIVKGIRAGKGPIAPLAGLISGALAGLSSITAGSGFYGPGAAVATSFVGTVASYFSLPLLGVVMGIDDPLGSSVFQAVPGAIGMLAVGIAADPLYFPNARRKPSLEGLAVGGSFELLGKQAVAVAFVAAWAGVFTLVILWAIDATLGINISPSVEEEGLDASDHGERAYDYTQIIQQIASHNIFYDSDDGESDVSGDGTGRDPFDNDPFHVYIPSSTRRGKHHQHQHLHSHPLLHQHHYGHHHRIHSSSNSLRRIDHTDKNDGNNYRSNGNGNGNGSRDGHHSGNRQSRQIEHRQPPRNPPRVYAARSDGLAMLNSSGDLQENALSSSAKRIHTSLGESMRGDAGPLLVGINDIAAGSGGPYGRDSAALRVQRNRPQVNQQQGRNVATLPPTARVLFERLCTACISGDIRTLTRLMQRAPRNSIALKATNFDRRNICHFACSSIQANAATASSSGLSALRLLSRKARNQFGVMCSSFDRWGLLPIDYALELGKGALVRWLLAATNREPRADIFADILIAASAAGDVVSVRDLIKVAAPTGGQLHENNYKPNVHAAVRDIRHFAGAAPVPARRDPNWCDINSRDYDGRTALIAAAFMGHANIAALLIAAGADPLPKDRWGFSAANYARMLGHRGVLTALADAGYLALIDNDEDRNCIDNSINNSNNNNNSSNDHDNVNINNNIGNGNALKRSEVNDHRSLMKKAGLGLNLRMRSFSSPSFEDSSLPLSSSLASSSASASASASSSSSSLSGSSTSSLAPSSQSTSTSSSPVSRCSPSSSPSPANHNPISNSNIGDGDTCEGTKREFCESDDGMDNGMDNGGGNGDDIAIHVDDGEEKNTDARNIDNESSKTNDSSSNNNNNNDTNNGDNDSTTTTEKKKKRSDSRSNSTNSAAKKPTIDPEAHPTSAGAIEAAIAVTDDDVDELKRLHRKGVPLATVTVFGGQSLLHLSAASRSESVVAYLLKFPNVCVNAKDDNGMTPLDMVPIDPSELLTEEEESIMDEAARVRRLRENKDSGGEDKTTLKTKNAIDPICNLIIAAGGLRARPRVRAAEMCHAAAHSDGIAILNLAARNGGHLFARDWSGRSALHIAAAEGLIDIARAILDISALPTAVAMGGASDEAESVLSLCECKDAYGRSAIDDAKASGHHELAAMLAEITEFAKRS